MKRKNTVILALLILCLTTCVTQADLSDPYQILQEHYQAIGGVDGIKAIKTRHVAGTVVIEGTGIEGTYNEWSERPIRNRQDVDLTVFKMTEGDNGEFSWRIDQNGRVQIKRDERSLKEHQIKILLAEFDQLNRESPSFDLSFEGIEKVYEKDCYVVRMTSTINDDITTSYYDKSSFRLLKTVVKKPDSEVHTVYSDYRKIDGVLVAFREEATEYPTKMKQIMQITSLETNITVDSSIFEPPAEQVADFRFLSGFSAEDIPLKYVADHIFIEVEIGGKKTLWCLDTGANVTLVEKWFAESLGLKPQGNLKGKGAGSVVEASFTTLPSFSLPGIEFNEQKVAVMDLRWLFSELMDLEVAGILGFDFLSRLVTKIDYAKQRISLYHPDHFSYQGPGVMVEAPISQMNHVLVPITVDGKYGGMWRLDTGAGGMWFHYPFAEKHGLLKRPGIYRLGAGAGGKGTHLQVRFSTIELAGMTVKDPIICLPLGKGEGAFADESLTGNVGNSLLRHFIIYLDYKHERLIVEKGDDFGRVFPEDNSGMQIGKTQDGGLKVIFVSEKTPAERAGLKVGDIIHSVNGVQTRYLGGIASLQEMLREKSGTKYGIEVIRESKSRVFELVLNDLYGK